MFAGLIALGLAAGTPAAVDYRQDASWLCRPGRADACAGPVEATSVAADGTLTPNRYAARGTPPIDCFYVYPTVSTDPTPNSDMTADAAERIVAAVQFAPFASVCRTFAPLYRQVTLAGLRSALSGGPETADRVLAYADVVAAWHDYLARDNGGRGVILIGHSQGSGIIKALLAHEIEGEPVAARVIAAYIPGTNLLVPDGKDVGGDLKTMPLCHSARQTGCVVAYTSFRDEAPPPASSRFGRSSVAGMSVACVNPAAIGGGRGPLQPLLPNRRDIVADAAAQPDWVRGKAVTTPFVELPGLLSAECRTGDGASWLAVRTDAAPGPRTSRIAGDVVIDGNVIRGWGLHLIDVNEATGNLLELAASQSAAWRAAH